MKKFKILFVLISLLFCLGNTIKADTIHIQMPGGVQSYCQSTGFDTFILHKPIGFGSTMWRINNITVGSGDSLVFVPTTIGVFGITSLWDGNVESTGLQLFSAAPPHPSPIGDTLSMCGPSLEVTANGLVGTDATYKLWTGPGLSSSINPVTIYNSGMYVFERGNPCGITRDTFYVVSYPDSLPVLSNALFCNTTVATIADAGSGYTYLWSPGGETTQSINITTPGTYTVSVTNACITGTVSMTVESQTFPLPDMFYQQGGVMCADSVVHLQPDQGGHVYSSYLWNTGATTSTLDISGLTTGSGTYSVSVTQGGCSASTSASFYFYQAPVVPEICIVTSSPVLNKNVVIFSAENEPSPGSSQYSPIDHYNIYKWISGTTYVLIGSVPVGQEHMFVDLTSNPPGIQATYKITSVDQCGVESAMSPFHTTILLHSSLGSTPGSITLTWDPYVDESGNFTVGTYEIYRGPHPDSLQYYFSTGFLSYNDFGVIGQVYYQIVAIRPGGCNSTPMMKKGVKTITAGSFSNITNQLVTNVPTTVNEELSIKIHSNPSSTGIFQIEVPNNGEKIFVQVADNLGRIVFKKIVSETTLTIDLAGYSSGIYHATIHNTQGSANCKLVIQ